MAGSSSIDKVFHSSSIAATVQREGLMAIDRNAARPGSGRVIDLALTYDDVLLVPNHSLVLPVDTNLETQFT